MTIDFPYIDRNIPSYKDVYRHTAKIGTKLKADMIIAKFKWRTGSGATWQTLGSCYGYRSKSGSNLGTTSIIFCGQKTLNTNYTISPTYFKYIEVTITHLVDSDEFSISLRPYHMNSDNKTGTYSLQIAAPYSIVTLYSKK